MRMAEYAYSKDLEMWNRQNEYNRPEAQMDRLKAAGLNPNLVYGSGSVAGNTSGQMPKYNAPKMEYKYSPLDVSQMIGAYQDFAIKQAQTDLLRQHVRSAEADADQKKWWTTYQTETKVKDVPWDGTGVKPQVVEVISERPFTKMARHQLQYKEGQNKKIREDINKTRNQNELLQKQIEHFMLTNFGKLGLDAIKSLGKIAKKGR